MFDLNGHVSIITGGNGGIGLAFARGLVKCGASVAIWARNESKNEAAIAELEGMGGNVKAFVCDVTDQEQIDRAFAETIDAFEKVDSCFANAGSPGGRNMLHQTPAEDWNGLVDLNVNSVVKTFRPVTEHMLQRGEGGKLIITSSVAALMGTPFNAGYATTKAAVVGMARSLAVELGQQGISVNALCPGYVESDFTDHAPQAFKDAAKRRSCLGRVGRVEDMEGVAVFMASSYSDYMTGHALVIDGGHIIHPL